ncbi:pyrimidodiazepine synthase-like isoform X2 [Venturia canescens]|uniref:pyrimidodiazepine synthase-like isoform X2 n=1 Tax=Venturia canescens TaxID=32260 RepID=UPI001C9CAE6F|nr:pyrimidodiazepine synthase-like isoform X2 [Venturia canescens]
MTYIAFETLIYITPDHSILGHLFFLHDEYEASEHGYDVVFVNLTNKPEWLQDKSPRGKVPCIEFENGDVLYESLIITDYLNEAHPHNNLYPDDPLLKAKDKLFIEIFNTVITTMYKLFTSPDANRELFEEALAGLKIFEKELALRGTAYFGGGKPGMLDLMIWPWCERADIVKILRGDKYAITRDTLPRLLEWRSAMREDPGVRVSCLDAEVHAKYMKSRMAGTPEYDLLAV